MSCRENYANFRSPNSREGVFQLSASGETLCSHFTLPSHSILIIYKYINVLSCSSKAPVIYRRFGAYTQFFKGEMWHISTTKNIFSGKPYLG